MLAQREIVDPAPPESVDETPSTVQPVVASTLIHSDDLTWKFKGPDRSYRIPGAVFEAKYEGFSFEQILVAREERLQAGRDQRRQLFEEHFLAGEYEEVYAPVDPDKPFGETGFVLHGGANSPFSQARMPEGRPGYTQVVWLPTDLHYDLYELWDEITWLGGKKKHLEQELGYPKVEYTPKVIENTDH